MTIIKVKFCLNQFIEKKGKGTEAMDTEMRTSPWTRWLQLLVSGDELE